MKLLCRALALATVVLGMHGAASAQFSPFLVGVRTFTPTAPVRLQIRTRLPTALAIDAIPVSVADVLAIRRHGNLVRLEELRSKRLRTVRDGVHMELEHGLMHDVRLGTLPQGYYVLSIHGGTAAGAQLVAVTSLGLVATRTPRGTLAFAVNVQTMHARTDVTVERYDAAGSAPRVQQASADGTAAFDEPAEPAGAEPALFVARGADGSVALADGQRSYDDPSTGTENGIVQLDRPIYRPGNRVEYRAILRDGEAGAYAIPAGTRTVRVRDPYQRIVYTATRKLDRHSRRPRRRRTPCTARRRRPPAARLGWSFDSM